MINKKLKNILLTKPGYQKKGFKWLLHNTNIFENCGITGLIDQIESLREVKAAIKKGNLLPLKNHTGSMLRKSWKVVSEINPITFIINKEIKVSTRGHIFKEFTKQYNIPGIHVILPCAHIPYHNEAFYEAFKRYIKGTNIKGLHIIGDFLDMNALSGHDKGNVGQSTLDFEYSAGNACLNDIQDILPSDCIKTYIWGNHEDRYNRYMKNVDNAKLGTALQSPTVGLDLINRGFHVFENWKQSYITIGKYLTLCHGEFCNVHTAKKHIDTYRKSVMYAHTHRKQVYIEGDTGGFNIGSMADFKKDAFGYATRAMKESWINSFAVVYIDNDGYYHVEIPTWINNKFLVGDKIFI